LKPTCNGYEVCKSHVPANAIINRVKDSRAKVLYIHRDLRDVVVSTMFKHKIRFSNVIESTTLSDAVGWGNTWEQLPGGLIQRYDELTNNIPAGIDQICDYIGIDLPQNGRDIIAHNHSIQKQQQRIQAIPRADQFDNHELLHHDHISNGNGQSLWQSVLADFQIKQIEDKYGAWLVGHGYELSIT
jgi:hypothetical protein